MGATEILTILKKKGELTSTEMAELLDVSLGAINHALKRILKDPTEDLYFRKMTLEEIEERYGKKIYSRIYVYRINE